MAGWLPRRQILGRLIRVDHKLDYSPPKPKEKDRDPDFDDVRIGSTVCEPLIDLPQAPQAMQPGHAYADKELATEFDIHKGVDVFAQPAYFSSDEDDEQMAPSKSRKERKRKHKHKHKKNSKHSTRKDRRGEQGSRRSRSPSARSQSKRHRSSRRRSLSRSESGSRRHRRRSSRSREHSRRHDSRRHRNGDRHQESERDHRGRSTTSPSRHDEHREQQGGSAPTYRVPPATKEESITFSGSRPPADVGPLSWRGKLDPEYRAAMQDRLRAAAKKARDGDDAPGPGAGRGPPNADHIAGMHRRR